jgi:exodeoxyribonuclease V gamma subunit
LGLLAQDAQNNWSWDVGLQRLLLGYAVGVGEGDGWQGLEPLDEVGGLEAALLGPLTCLLQTLDAHWRALATPAVPAVWGERLRALLADCFLATQEGDSLTLQRLEDALQAWLEACESAALTEALPLSVVGAHWLAQLDVPTLNQPFMSGGVTFATLMPMRAIPFRVVALLGMNDGDYPRSRVPMDFDLMRLDIRPGDRSRREDDRYLFLEALLSARERLHISWVGRSIQDQSERTPSVLVAQLRDHLAAGWRLEGDASLSSAQAGGRLLEALTVAHRLQPFHPAYFTKGGDARLFSYAREWRVRTSEALTPTPLPEGEGLEILPLRRLTDFLKDPVRAFFRWRLGVHFDADVLATGDQEPFALDHLQRWRLQDELIRVQKAAVGVGASRQEMLAAHLNRLARRGELPAGGFATLIAEELAEPMAAAFERYTQALADWPQVLPDEAIDHLDSSASSHPSKILHLVDELGDLRANVEGARCRLLLDSNDLVKKGKLGKDRGWAYHKIAPFWVEHVCAHLCNKALTTRIIGKTGDVTLPPLTAEEAQAYWHVLRDAWQQGLRRPLPFALRSALAWLSKIEDGAEDASAWEAARARYEDHAPDFGKRGERDSSPYLARAFPTFEALWSQGEFAAWSRALLQPVLGGRGGWRKTA